jgi:hypothetical protein
MTIRGPRRPTHNPPLTLCRDNGHESFGVLELVLLPGSRDSFSDRRGHCSRTLTACLGVDPSIAADLQHPPRFLVVGAIHVFAAPEDFFSWLVSCGGNAFPCEVVVVQSGLAFGPAGHSSLQLLSIAI